GLMPPRAASCVSEGRVHAASIPGYARVPAKIMLAGTGFSTTADAEGRFRFRNLPPGEYTAIILATGYELKEISGVALRPERPHALNVELNPDAIAGNLVRNPRFALRWLSADAPDWWMRDPLKNGRWASALVRVPVGQKCRLRVEFVPGKETPVAIRWRANPALPSDSREQAVQFAVKDNAILSADVSLDTTLRPFEKNLLFLEVLIEASALPDAVRHVAITYVP